jgi:peroxiredoxin
MKKILFTVSVCIASLFVFAQEAPEGLFIGSKAPDFRATDQNAQEFRLKDELKKGKVILVFYRGQWCPYCNRFLSKLQDSLQLIADKGARVVAVGAEKPENISVTVEKTKASFSVLHDKDLKIMKAYEVEYEVPENTIRRYKNGNIDIEKNNGDNGRFLPVPAIYIIDQESTVTYRFFDADYRKRPSVAELLENLR